jgi:fibronectin-binding autotransporter adhesin
LSATSANWSDSANWQGGIVPGTGDDIVFPGGALQLTNFNDFSAAGPFNSITFTGNAGGYKLQGNPIFLHAGVTNNSNNPSINFVGLGLTLNASQTFSSGTAGGSLEIIGNVNVAGFTLTLDGTNRVEGTSLVETVFGTIAGSGAVVKNGTGDWILRGANSYTGITTVHAGILGVASASALGSPAAGTIVNAGGTLGLGLGAPNLNFTVTEPLTLNGNGGTFPGAIGAGFIAADITVASTVTLGSASSVAAVSSSPGRLFITGIVNSNGFNLTAVGPLNLNITGSIAGGGAVVTSAALLSGTGTINGPLIVSQGGLLPGIGTQPGVLTTGAVTFNPGSSFEALVNGTAAGSGFSQLQVNGTVSLGGSTFSPTVNFNAVAGNSFVVINSSGSITGTFAGLPNGAVVNLDGQPFQILYVSPGRSGHLEASSQVILTRIESATTAGAFGSIPPGVNVFATAADAGGGPDVKVYSATTGTALFNFFAYDPNFTGGVRVAVGDVNGDGVPDIITAAGPGGGPNVIVWDGRNGSQLYNFFAYDIHFTGGVYVAAGDILGDGHADIICGADAGGGPNVTVFSGKDGHILRSFFAYDPRFTGGVRVAAGDVNGDGFADIICGAGPGGGPNVTVFSGNDGSILRSFFAYDPGFSAGIYVAAGDVNGDGKADVITGAGAGGGPNVSVIDVSAMSIQVLSSFFPYDPGFTGGVRVGAASRGSDTHPDVISVAGPGGGPDVRSFNGLTGQLIDQFFAYNPLFTGGLYLAGSGR